MAYYGKITSFESEMNAGTISSHGSGQAIMFFGGDVQLADTQGQSLVGQRVAFDIVHTAKGAMAINIKADRRSPIRPGDTLATVVAPLLVAGLGYYFYTEIYLSPLLSYLAAVNVVAFILLICHSSRGYSRRTTSSEVLLAAMAAGGASISIFFASALVPCKWRSDAGRFALFALLVLQLLALHSYAPGLFSTDFREHVYRLNGDRLNVDRLNNDRRLDSGVRSSRP